MDSLVLRPMAPQDLHAVLDLQCRGYPPPLHDSEAAFLSRMALAPGLNLTAWSKSGLAGYLVSHPWAAGDPPPVDALLAAGTPAECWYVHDLSVAEAARGLGLARTLLSAGRDAARALGLARSELIAVEGAAPFWIRQGWRPPQAVSQALAAKVAGYGPAAVFMTREELGDL
ncbi:MAG: GNAT family N-acetyltransferase [Phenylobacterium sp.]|uniref:GNAT family N-acetyltransferase n=1 Tax=Phenylobacterium sp. TaxID=1871053 RepID=UPI002720C21F|nr:GNAT family N-acetyltransferase [Phenylobacterium sp.]MDO8899929.1 GNAT family N-acetyltransferase [Phenylobacterium sp.]